MKAIGEEIEYTLSSNTDRNFALLYESATLEFWDKFWNLYEEGIAANTNNIRRNMEWHHASNDAQDT